MHHNRFFCRAVIAAYVSMTLTNGIVCAEMRTWENLDGRKTVAEFVKLDKDMVYLKLGSGREGKVALKQLSIADQDYVAQKTVKPTPVSPQLEVQPIPAKKTIEAPKTWPNDDGMNIPSDVMKPWIYAPGVACKMEDVFWDPSGKKLWENATFSTNGLTFFGSYSTTKMTYTKGKERHGIVNLEGRFILGGDSNLPLPEGTIAIGEPGDNGLIAFSKKVGEAELWGYINLKGEIVIDAKWHYATRFSNGLAAVSLEKPGYLRDYFGGFYFTGKYVYIDEKGNEEVSGGWQVARPFFDGHAAVCLPREVPSKSNEPNRWALVKKDGKLFVPGDFQERMFEFRDGRLVTKTAIYDSDGKIIFTAPEPYTIFDCDDASGVCILSGGAGLPSRLVHRKSGRCYGPLLDFKIIWPFSEGLACVSVDGKSYGFIDRTGKIVIQPKFSHPYDYKNGYISVRNKELDKSELWNRQGEKVSE
jgi:hypothetical protein